MGKLFEKAFHEQREICNLVFASSSTCKCSSQTQLKFLNHQYFFLRCDNCNFISSDMESPFFCWNHKNWNISVENIYVLSDQLIEKENALGNRILDLLEVKNGFWKFKMNLPTQFYYLLSKYNYNIIDIFLIKFTGNCSLSSILTDEYENWAENNSALLERLKNQKNDLLQAKTTEKGKIAYSIKQRFDQQSNIGVIADITPEGVITLSSLNGVES